MKSPLRWAALAVALVLPTVAWAATGGIDLSCCPWCPW